MAQIRAFVGHSFTAEDQEVVATFLAYFDQMKGALPDFDWVHARAAEPTELAAKVLKLIEGQNVFIGICTRRERVISDEKLRTSIFRGARFAAETDLLWKTSDWIIQEIGLAVGRKMAIVLLIETGCRKPGGLQGDVEFIPFDRLAPERAFGQLLEMMKALSPRRGAGEVTSDEPGEVIQDESEAPSAQENDTPDDTWDRGQYENAYLWRLISDDTAGAAKIEAAFRASKHAVQEESSAEWNATTELWRIRFGKEGSLERIRECETKFRTNPTISSTLAGAYSSLSMHSEAAKQYLDASELVPDDNLERDRLRGLAAVQLAKAGDAAASDKLLKEIRSALGPDTRNQELNYLNRMREITTDIEDKRGEIEVLERILQLTPDDWNSRFNLAYKYSQVDLNDMSLYHYTKIPYAERTPVTWNNLGVAYQDFSMPAKAVQAYRISASKGETLAMSNLAYKLMRAGFLKEADEELQNALKADDFHRNVGQAVSALKDIPDNEEQTLKKTLKAVETKRQFFEALGRATTSPDVEDLPELWKGPECSLKITIKDGHFYASGEYDRVSDLLSGLLSQESRTSHYQVHYKGKILGHRVVGTVSKKSDRSASNTSILGNLGANGDETDFAMVVDTKLCIISVAEKHFSSSPNFYQLTVQGTPAQAS